jgi:hypothetical protein
VLLKRLSDVGLSDIATLCENRVLESRFIDFKADAIGGGDREKREFLADVSAFANASGGDIVLGVKTKDGAADEVCGVVLEDPDKEKLRLGSIVRDGLEPRISGLDMSWLRIEEKRGVLVIRVPRSWTAPHRVTFLKDMNFYDRNAAGKHPMSVDELRQSFNLSRDLAQRLRDFRGERIEAILAKDLPVDLRDGPKLVLHIVPLSTVADPLDLQFKQGAPGIVPPLRNESHSWLHTVEGYVTYTMPAPSRSYSMMFRNGAVEGVGGIDPNYSGREVSLHAVERLVLNGWSTFRDFAAAFGVEPPILLGIQGLAPPSTSYGFETPVPARKDALVLPAVVVGVDQFASPPPQLFKHLFDTAANSFGLSGSPNYDANGKYTG